MAGTLPSATCPPDFSCFSIAPQDGACRHPAVIFDEKIKATRYEGDRFSSASEKDCIAQTNAVAARRGLQLSLKFSNGTSKVYKNNYTAAACEQHQDSCKMYFLYDYFPENSLFLINVSYNEDQQWFLVSRLDGREQKIVAPPGYSPSKKWLASVYATEAGDEENNGIDIFPANLNQTASGFHYRPKDDEYEQWVFVAWDGDDRLLLKVTWRVGNNPELVTWPAEVVHSNGKWQLNRKAPSSPTP